jgi:UDP-3-O-[3-hydroxymyristoyl] glucosamine N-acyltransferase
LAVSLGELASRFGGEVHGDRGCPIRGVASLERAGEGEISFLSNVQFRRHLAATRASAVILEPRFLPDCPVNALVTADPYLVFARVAQALHPPPPAEPGVHATAVLGRDCRMGDRVSVGPHAVLGEGVRLGDRVRVGPGCVIEDGVEVGADSVLEAGVVLHRGTRLGARVLVHSGAVIGGDGFGFANDRGRWVKIPQLGGVQVGDDVEIGSNTTVDRGALGDTVIEEGVKLDNQVQIAHNVRIGAHTAIAGCTGVAGSAVIGKRCAIGGGVGISGHLEIADDVQLTGTTFVSQSITEKGTYSSGVPFEPTRAWRRNFLRIRQLDDMARRLGELERLIRAMRDSHEPTGDT